jgi:hypothetical protein
MQAYYRSILGQDGPASPEERQALRHAMIDYGALQPSPVQHQSSPSLDVRPSLSPSPPPANDTPAQTPHSKYNQPHSIHGARLQLEFHVEYIAAGCATVGGRRDIQPRFF